MKRVLALLAIFSLEACKLEPPKRPTFENLKGGSLPAVKDTKDPSTPGVPTPGTPGDYDLKLKCTEKDTRRGLRSWRRLSNVEVRNTVQDVFKIDKVDVTNFPSDVPKKELYDTMSVSSNHLSDARFLPLETFAKDIASRVNMGSFFPCIKEGASCLNSKLPDLLADAWRRPALDSEVKDLSGLYSALTMDGVSSDESLRSVVTAIILSHNFLYRSELGKMKAEMDNSYVLDDYEIASGISYTLWRRPPDAELKALAKKGGLNDSEAIRTIATKMMNDPKAKEAWRDFGTQWLDGNRIQNVVKKDAPDFTPQVKEKMKAEASAFLSYVMFEKSGGAYKDLLQAAETPSDSMLDSYYGSKANGKLTKYMQPERQGLLGQVSFLASHATDSMANPILRGAFISERLLCEQFIGIPPTTAPEVEPGKSTKDIFKSKTSPPVCQSCHKSIDGLGYALGNFDHLGRYQKEDNGAAVDTSGTFTLDGRSVSFTNPQELSEAISSSVQGQMCFARQVFNYGYGRKEFAWRPVAGRKSQPYISAQGRLDYCEIESATAAMIAKKGDLKTVIVEYLASPAFRYRLIGEPEILK